MVVDLQSWKVQRHGDVNTGCGICSSEISLRRLLRLLAAGFSATRDSYVESAWKTVITDSVLGADESGECDEAPEGKTVITESDEGIESSGDSEVASDEKRVMTGSEGGLDRSDESEAASDWKAEMTDSDGGLEESERWEGVSK
jgi:hypothetical protein